MTDAFRNEPLDFVAEADRDGDLWLSCPVEGCFWSDYDPPFPHSLRALAEVAEDHLKEAHSG